MKRVALCCSLLLTPAHLHAGEFCLLDDTELFACTFQDGKKAVELCDAVWLDDAKVTYGFFRPGAGVEKEIVADMAGLVTEPWSGTGDHIFEAVTIFADDAYGYQLWWSGARAPDSEISGGINVLHKGETIAAL